MNAISLPPTAGLPLTILLSVLVAWAAEPAVSRLMPGVAPGWAFVLVLLGLLLVFHVI